MRHERGQVFGALTQWRKLEDCEAFEEVLSELPALNEDLLIGDIEPPAELMKTQTDRKIAEELQITYDVQRQAEVQRQTLEREPAITGAGEGSGGASRLADVLVGKMLAAGLNRAG